MKLNLKDKKLVIEKINKMARKSISAVIANYNGVTSNQMNELRKMSRLSGIYSYIVRNTLIKRALMKTHLQCLISKCVGSIIIAFSTEHPGIAARVFKDFSNINVNFKLQAASFNNNLILASQINILANLPTYEEAIIKLLAIVQEISVKKLIYVLLLINKT